MEDYEIVKLFSIKSDLAIKEVEKKYGRYIYYICLCVTGRHEDAEECFNDSLYILWSRIPLSQPQSLPAYIRTVAYHVALGRMDYYNAAKRDRQLEEDFDENRIGTGGNNIEELIEKLCIVTAFQKFMHGLSLEKQCVFTEKYNNSKSIEEISNKYGMSQSKVKMMLFRMRQEFKKRLEEENIYI